MPKKNDSQRKNHRSCYQGFGFMEAVLAIIIVGIVCVVFLMLLVESIKSLREMENYDHLTRKAFKLTESVRGLASEQKGSIIPKHRLLRVHKECLTHLQALSLITAVPQYRLLDTLLQHLISPPRS